MANTYTQIYVQIVFAVKNRFCIIPESFRVEIQKYISRIITQEKCKLYSIYCNPDHTHLLVGMRPSLSISDLTRDIKSVSSKFINEKAIFSNHFKWQDGFGAFTYSQSQISNVIKYIENQPNHHQKQSFKDEYLDFLDKLSVEYEKKYLFDWILD